MGYYRKVAVVLCDSLESVFALTQGDWLSNHGVCPIEDETGRGYRSTRVGDIIVMDDQEAFAVAMAGFEPLPLVVRADHITTKLVDHKGIG
jgi:hypothetical protein